MTPEELAEARQSFIDERMSILWLDSGIYFESLQAMAAEAERCWESYRREHKLFLNDQVKI